MSKRRRPAASRRLAEQRFWGAGYEPSAINTSIRPTPDPGVVVRSLGAPPLAIDASVASRHLTAVYEEAVRAATALAAANGLLAGPEEDD
ncbi:MAG TPA: hypothetical protein VG435_18565 [Acidimicrobiales bacterium]|jgi:hypothetical protein|nr:hypothetical protein [Acidimicrobiales bacterium]